MLTRDLINYSIPQLQVQDSVAKALQLMNDFRLTHLPVIQDSMLLGLISEDELLDVQDEQVLIQSLSNHFIQATVKSTDYFLAAVKSCMHHEVRLTAVLDEHGEYMGCVTSWDLFKNLGEYVGVDYPGSIIVLSVERVHYALSEICRIVENNDATILQLNTQTHPDTDLMTVTLQINKQEVSAILATFERYSYNVIYNHGIEDFVSDIESNYKHLMNYLNI